MLQPMNDTEERLELLLGLLEDPDLNEQAQNQIKADIEALMRPARPSGGSARISREQYMQLLPTVVRDMSDEELQKFSRIVDAEKRQRADSWALDDDATVPNDLDRTQFAYQDRYKDDHDAYRSHVSALLKELLHRRDTEDHPFTAKGAEVLGSFWKQYQQRNWLSYRQTALLRLIRAHGWYTSSQAKEGES